MQSRTIKKWGLITGGVVTALIVAAMIVLFVLINQTVDSIYGGQTELADHAQFQVEAEPTAITNVSVLSPDGTEMLAGRTVLLKDGEIQSVSEDPQAPGGMRVIDGTGKFLIPGLLDSHAHLHRSPNDLLLYAATGVTQIRSMNGSEADLELKREIENGRIGPHYYVSSPSMNSDNGFGEVGDTFPSWVPAPVAIWLAETMFSLNISTDADEAADDARAFIAKGHDGIKLYGFLNIESYRAILDAVEDLDVPTVGHLPDAMPLSELRTTKLSEIAHIEEIVKALRREFNSLEDKGDETYLEMVERRKGDIIADLVANDIAVQSTMWYTESLYDQILNLEAKIKDVRLEYANPGIVEGAPSSGSGWLPGSNKFETYYADETAEEIAEGKQRWQDREKAHHILLQAMVENDVTILAGTDANGWLTVPGFSLHDELQTLAQAGMSPAQALYSATAAPAKRIRNNAGIIEAGRRADLVLLNKNPLTDIENTTAIETVILNGKVLDRSRLDAMLEAVSDANASSRNFDLSLYQ